MSDQKALVTLKDGTKITVDDVSQLSQYSNRQDLDSISFFGDNDALDAGTQETVDAGAAEKIVAVVEQPKADPVVPKPQPTPDHGAAVTATIGALAGALSSAGMPALSNLAKSFIKGKLKIKKSDSKPEEEKEQPTDCKTHQIKAAAKFASINARLSTLESKNSGGDSRFSKLNSEDIDERLEKLERIVKGTKKGKK